MCTYTHIMVYLCMLLVVIYINCVYVCVCVVTDDYFYFSTMVPFCTEKFPRNFKYLCLTPQKHA